MKRALGCVVIAWMALSGCDKPCKPGYAKAGYDCKKLPEVDAGLADGGGEQNEGGAANGGMDGGTAECLPPACDPCEVNPCANGGACEATARGYSCTCPLGFMGVRCQIDPCELDPCLHGGECKRSASGRMCSCGADWTGDSCETNTNPKLANIVPSAGTLYPPFAPSVLAYSLDLGVGEADVTFTLTAMQPDGVQLLVGDETVPAGIPSSPLALALNLNPPRQVVVRATADDGSEASYSITVRRTLTQQAYVKRPSGGTTKNFGGDDPGYQDGQMLSLRGDTLAIADAHDDSDRGAVYLLSRNVGTWGFSRFFAGDAPGARLGSAVLVSDALLVIGAPGEDEVRVYERKDLISADPEFDTLTIPVSSPAIAQFGKALALVGNTLFVGAPGTGEQAPAEMPTWGGEVHIFEREGQGWIWTQVITSPDPNASKFGARIAAEAGVLVVGDPNAGTVYVYRKDAQSWASDGKLNLDDDGLGLTALGGAAVGISNGRIAVAETYVGIFSGFIGEPRLSVFEPIGDSWLRTGTTMLARDPQVPNESVPAGFGMTGLSFTGRTVIVGAQYAPGFGPGVSDTINYAQAGVADPGAAYVFSESAQGWGLAAHVKASNPGVGDNFGSRVAFDGNTVVVSAASEDSGGKGVGADQSSESLEDSGAVYIFGIDCTQVPSGASVPGC